MPVKPSIIKKKGEKVLVKRDESKKKSDVPYNTTANILHLALNLTRKGQYLYSDRGSAKCYLSHEEHLVFQDGADSRLTECFY